jgi:hypothetical protein
MTPAVSSTGQLKLFPGNVRAGVVRMNGADLVHHVMLNEALYKFIEAEAKTHEAAFQGGNFEKVIDAVVSNKMCAYFLVVESENCRRSIAGGATEIPTVITEWNGLDFEHRAGVYGEDTYVSPDKSEAFRRLTGGHGLGSFFVHERIRLSLTNEFGSSPFGMISRGRVAEIAEDNAVVGRILHRLDPTYRSQDCVIVQIDPRAPPFRRGRRIPVQTEGLASEHDHNRVHILPNVFVTAWSDGHQKLVASFTEAMSTFSGEPVVRVQFTSNGALPVGDRLKDILAALISEGRLEIMRRKWLSQSGNVRNLADSRMIMRVHAFDPDIVSALREMDGQPRSLGPHPMIPVITNLRNTPAGAVDFPIPAAKPLTVVKSPFASHAPRPAGGSAGKMVASSAALG